MTATLEAKARRLYMAGNVERLDRALPFAVRGDHRTYIVVLNGDGGYCECPAIYECAHLRAARLHYENGGEPLVTAASVATNGGGRRASAC